MIGITLDSYVAGDDGRAIRATTEKQTADVADYADCINEERDLRYFSREKESDLEVPVLLRNLRNLRFTVVRNDGMTPDSCVAGEDGRAIRATTEKATADYADYINEERVLRYFRKEREPRGSACVSA